MEEPKKEDKITPEMALAHFMEQNKYANRHERRMFKKLMGIKLPVNNIPYIKEKCLK